MLRFVFYAAIVAILFEWKVGLASFSQVKTGEVSKAAQICSSLGVVFENANAIRSGDVLILKRDFFDGIDRYSEQPKGGTLRRQILLRMMFDLDQGLFLAIRQIAEERFELDEVTVTRDGRTSNSAVDGELFEPDLKNSVRLLQDGVVMEDLIQKSASVQLLLERWQDPRRYGLIANSSRYSLYFTGDQLHQVVETEKSVEIQLIGSISELGSKHIVSTRLDRTTMLPDRNRTFTILPKGLTASNDRYFRWKEMEKLHVPIQTKANFLDEYIVSKLNSQRIQERREAEVDSQIDLHWFSINRPLEKKFFNIKTLKDKDQVIKLINPEKSEATTIIEELMKSQEKSEAPSPSNSRQEEQRRSNKKK